MPVNLGVANFVISVVSAAAAILAVFYARRGLSKDDLVRVEKHTGASAESIRAVQVHIAAVEAHLGAQNRRIALEEHANRIGFNVSGGGFIREDIELTIHSLVAGMRLDLLNSSGRLSGTVHCRSLETGSFIGRIPSDEAEEWFSSGAPSSVSELQRELFIRAYVPTDAGEVHRLFPVMGYKYAKLPSNTLYLEINGRC